ncbi:polysaccharide lyase family 7 protein [Vibrio breoganii]|uniref:polysaccharide lyase family 7 protein n=1 Tax=Vibrio breoganii TaxID=553239 RepID=UPI0018E4117B|nr:polysaccharide lyase family 7 protein [Vibrio breoganii]
MNKSILALMLATALTGCGGSDSQGNNNNPNDSDPGTSDPVEPGDPIAPYSITKYQDILSNSDLQQSDPYGNASNKESVVTNGDFYGYYDEYFYAQENTQYLVFKMSNYSMRNEVRERDNFDINVEDEKRTLLAEVKLPGIEDAMSNSSSSRDQVTFLQIHNKGTSSDGTGYIPHPLLRVVYELERDGKYGHYWAVVKNNAVDCKGDGSDPDSAECQNAYDRYDLGEADTDAFTKFELIVQENNLSIEVNDIVKADLNIAYWEHLLSYFKAGVYNQFENGESEAHFRALKVLTGDSNTAYDWDIDSWKLTIPASKYDWYESGDTDSPAELTPARCDYSDKDTLSNDTDIPYFWIEDGRIHFSAEMNYGTSTANSSRIRSELRELYISNENPDCSTSDEDTSWYLYDNRTNEAISTHTLNASLKIESFPRIEDQDPKVVLGQIHGWKINQALIKLQWEGENKPVRALINDKYATNNQSCNDCNTYSVELGTYAAGEEWGYTIRANEDELYVATFDADGSNRKEHLITWGASYKDRNDTSFVLSNTWTSDEIAFYFKAGIYPQFETDEDYSGQIFDVSFSSLNIDHY